MEGKGLSNVVLLIIIAFLSLTLAVLAGYVFIVGGSPRAAVAVEKDEIKRPADKDLAQLKLFNEKSYFNLKVTDGGKTPVILFNMDIKYFKKVKGIKSVDEKINSYITEMREVVGTYFQNMTYEEAKLPETKEKAKKELTEKINEVLLASEKNKKNIVYTVVFEEWFYQ